MDFACRAVGTLGKDEFEGVSRVIFGRVDPTDPSPQGSRSHA